MASTRRRTNPDTLPDDSFSSHNDDDNDDYTDYYNNTNSNRPAKGTWMDYMFGFLYDDDELLDETDTLYRSTVEDSTPLWNNSLHLALFAVLFLTSAATSIPIALQLATSTTSSSSSSAAAAAAATTTTSSTSYAMIGASLGKFLNGPVSDICGARRTSVAYSLLLAAALLALACAQTPAHMAAAGGAVEFANAVQWPCVIVTLAAHGRGNAAGLYENGIFVTSLASRLGPVVAIPVASILLQPQTESSNNNSSGTGSLSWRWIAVLGAWLALMASSVSYLYVKDAPGHVHQAQNPVHWQKWFEQTSTFTASSSSYSSNHRRRSPLAQWLGKFWFLLQHNVLPSVRHVVFSSPTFWMVAAGHTGAALLRSSERLLGDYLTTTTHPPTGSCWASSVTLSLGTVTGLATAGHAFGRCRTERDRKWLVSRLYVCSIVACYALSFLSVVRHPADLMLIFQLMAIFVAGFGVAVPAAHIPSLVGATYGCDKGLFAAYADGVGYAVASWVWHGVLGDLIQQRGPMGWAYGWAAVALWLIVSAVFMVEFMEHYFCRPKHGGGTYETIIFA